MRMKISDLIEQKLKEYANILFPSKEDDGIEHVDASYEDFMAKLKEDFEDVADAAYKKAKGK